MNFKKNAVLLVIFLLNGSTTFSMHTITKAFGKNLFNKKNHSTYEYQTPIKINDITCIKVENLTEMPTNDLRTTIQKLDILTCSDAYTTNKKCSNIYCTRNLYPNNQNNINNQTADKNLTEYVALFEMNSFSLQHTLEILKNLTILNLIQQEALKRYNKFAPSRSQIDHKEFHNIGDVLSLIDHKQACLRNKLRIFSEKTKKLSSE